MFKMSIGTITTIQWLAIIEEEKNDKKSTNNLMKNTITSNRSIKRSIILVFYSLLLRSLPGAVINAGAIHCFFLFLCVCICVAFTKEIISEWNILFLIGTVSCIHSLTRIVPVYFDFEMWKQSISWNETTMHHSDRIC